MANSSIVNFNVTRPELCNVGVFVFSLVTISVYSCMSYLYPDELIINVSHNQIKMPGQNLSNPKKPFFFLIIPTIIFFVMLITVKFKFKFAC